MGALAVVGLLREAGGGGASGYAPLVLIPVIWIALYGSVGEFVIGLIGVATVFWLPLVIGAPGYPQTEWQRGLFMLITAVAVAATLLGIVGRLRDAASRARLIIQRSHDAFISMDESGTVTDWNPAAEHMFGWTCEVAVGQRLADLIIPPRMREAHERGRLRYLQTGESRLLDRAVEIEALRSDGSEVPVELSITAQRTRDGCVFNAFLRDISERRHAQQLSGVQYRTATILASAVAVEDALAPVLETVGRALGWDVVVYWVMGQDALRPRELWNDPDLMLAPYLDATRRCELVPPEGLPGRAWTRGTPESVRDLGQTRYDLRWHAAEECQLRDAIALPVRNSEGIVAVLELAGRPGRELDDSTLKTLEGLASQLGLFEERVRRSDLLRRVEETARTDPLTALPNRRGWDEELPRAIARAGRSKRPMCLAMIDLDRFKAFNDESGHLAGDRLLQEVTAAWRGKLRATDVLARFGGDEFAAIFPDCDLEKGLELVNRLGTVTPRPVACSVGVALWDGSESRWSLLDRADQALYDAKAAGGNCAVAAERTRAAEPMRAAEPLS